MTHNVSSSVDSVVQCGSLRVKSNTAFLHCGWMFASTEESHTGAELQISRSVLPSQRRFVSVSPGCKETVGEGDVFLRKRCLERMQMCGGCGTQQVTADSCRVRDNLSPVARICKIFGV